MTSLLSAAPLGVRVPAFRTAPPSASAGPAEEYLDLADRAGLVLDGWQQDEVRDTVAEGADGRCAALRKASIVPRQNGKGAILECLELGWLFLPSEIRLILHTAHELKTSLEAYLRLKTLIKETAFLDRRVSKYVETNGKEAIELRNGVRLKFIARSGGSGRGLSGDRVVLDEAYNLSDGTLSALIPTLSARPDPQIVITSSAPTLEPRSDDLRRLCKEGRAGGPRLAYSEWCADPTGDPDDDGQLGKANPGLGIRLHLDFVRTVEQPTLTADDFDRERLGRWIDPAEMGTSPIPIGAWDACVDPAAPIPASPCFAFDVSPDRAHASIAVAGRRKDGRRQVEVVDDDGVPVRIDRVVPRLVELAGKHKPPAIACDPTGPAGALLPALAAAGLEVVTVTTQDHQRACGAIYDGVMDATVRHIGQPALRSALLGAVQRTVGDAWLWSRRNSRVDITPLVASTLALWAESTAPAVGDVLDNVW